jgi:hypothetical protein
MRQHLEKASIATVANRDVNNLRWSAKEQCSVIEVNVLTEDDETLYVAAFPNVRISGRQ